jgi:hypothetical protein
LEENPICVDAEIRLKISSISMHMESGGLGHWQAKIPFALIMVLK